MRTLLAAMSMALAAPAQDPVAWPHGLQSFAWLPAGYDSDAKKHRPQSHRLAPLQSNR